MATSIHHIESALSVSNAVIAASTKPEPFGRIPLEAAAVGSWMIAQSSGFSETIKHQNTGYLYQPNQLDDLVSFRKYSPKGTINANA